ncbi:hypothetical protein [Flavivirga spongiicola]|uniref:DUF4249 family protein n=1 Tax=Flavivirga spongiicola TaxID=421621 RepID=A0ABU7XQ53_9FLAO|nr:hypothetical protein [Flavivirga sp. MEBiC05379]MDO5977700.1 hypothetical protein [Flavivirga sp. MEBiC05379]
MKNLNILFFLLLASCATDSYQDLVKVDTIINLKWNKAYPDDTINKSVIGLQWALSYIGAKLPNYNSNLTLNGNIIKIDTDKLGLTDNAKQKLTILNNNIKNSNEYKITSSVDLGRYVTLLIGVSQHYYEIVDVPNELSSLLDKYTLKPEKGYINNSNISLEHRIINFSEQSEFNQLFISTEVDPENQTIFEYETIEILPNGQLRFGIFDENGFRKNNASPLHTNAGKPAKCIWCHESGIQPLFSLQNDFTGYLTYLEFRDTLLNYRSSHNTNKNALLDGVGFSNTQEHTLTELLYISFMEASAERLSLEWNLPIEEVKNRLSGISTHTYDEFPFLGDLYYRNEIRPFAPFKGLEVSSSVREKSETEVNHIN